MSQPESITKEHYDYGRLWPDGTFRSLHTTSERYARREFNEKAYELKEVPESLRPVFARQRVVTTIETYTAEAAPDEAAK